MNYYIAPVQGHTDAAYRHFHHKVYDDSNIKFTTPFIRLEKDEIRLKDKKDLLSDLNNDINLVPQIIFRDHRELEKLIEIIKSYGFKEIDLNMGCPFPLQVSHGRGCATVSNATLGAEVRDIINKNDDIRFSVKIRLGAKEANEWETLLPFLNDTNIKYLTIHPRIGKQQYTGTIDIEEFEKILKESKNPVVFNGDIKTPDDLKKINERFPEIQGIMCGRGLLGRPSLFEEVRKGDHDKRNRLDKMLKFHNLLFSHYSEVLCGDSQILSKIKPFWEYAEEEIGRKSWKAIKKATSIAKYNTAVSSIEI